MKVRMEMLRYRHDLCGKKGIKGSSAMRLD
jgi:hypothetical protein